MTGPSLSSHSTDRVVVFVKAQYCCCEDPHLIAAGNRDTEGGEGIMELWCVTEKGIMVICITR